ncbi:hypothetical protein BE221DRAFT_78251 [Ostreococcus tauri]|uniref:Uncharacterized protein n=1 Tax=Ostreococcus tauri TaxID=70448 RepID=A0A1Y5IAW6_OSTTA|nr:hypothetical protein BE221DRAFT_78251 [Ostreococcus tauri]
MNRIRRDGRRHTKQNPYERTQTKTRTRGNKTKPIREDTNQNPYERTRNKTKPVRAHTNKTRGCRRSGDG